MYGPSFAISNPYFCFGKGNSTISYVHDFFTSHGVGETDAQINADNCGGKTKITLLFGIIAGEFFVANALADASVGSDS